MARFADVERAALGPDGAAAWEYVAGTRGAIIGPYRPLMAVPELARRVAELGSAIRFAGLLAGADRELAICAAGREMACGFEWAYHTPIALAEGVRPEALEIVRQMGPLDGLTGRERLLVEVVRALCRERTIGEELFERALAELGQRRLVELVTLVGYYGMLSCVLNAFEVPLPEGAAQPF